MGYGSWDCFARGRPPRGCPLPDLFFTRTSANGFGDQWRRMGKPPAAIPGYGPRAGAMRWLAVARGPYGLYWPKSLARLLYCVPSQVGGMVGQAWIGTGQTGLRGAFLGNRTLGPDLGDKGEAWRCFGPKPAGKKPGEDAGTWWKAVSGEFARGISFFTGWGWVFSKKVGLFLYKRIF